MSETEDMGALVKAMEEELLRRGEVGSLQESARALEALAGIPHELSDRWDATMKRFLG